MGDPLRTEDSRTLDEITGYIELMLPGRQFILWLFDDHTKYENRLIDTPVNFAASKGIGGEVRGQNLMREKLERWSKG